MRLAHVSDLHLGFRQFDRITTKGDGSPVLGINRREADIEQTLHALIDQLIAIAPDLIIIGGDFFHVVRPSNHAVVNAFQEWERLTQSLPLHRVVLVAGNHDAPRSTDTGGILGLFASLGIHVVDKAAARIEFDDISCAVLAVPDIPGLVRPAFTPKEEFQHNVLIMHGEVQGMPAAFRSDKEILAADLNVPAWSYIGLGHYHVYSQLARNMYYSGSIDYTSTDPWGELRQEAEQGIPGKGFIEHDLETGAHTFHPLPCSRPHIDLPVIDATELTSEQLDAAIRANVDAVSGGIDSKVVRQVVAECRRDVSAALDKKAVKSFHLRALNFNLVVRRPERIRTATLGTMARSRSQTLAERVGEFLRDRVDVPGVDKTDLVTMAGHYLEQANGGDDFALAKMLEASLAQNEEPVQHSPAAEQAA